MTTRIYGASDDLVEFEGTIHGEVGCFGTDDDEDLGILVGLDDGTLLAWQYGKGGLGVWGCTVLVKGSAFVSLTACNNEDSDPYSDVVIMSDGATEAWSARHAMRVR
jgi:hypothetical protein